VDSLLRYSDNSRRVASHRDVLAAVKDSGDRSLLKQWKQPVFPRQVA